jgi:hypothetical protein
VAVVTVPLLTAPPHSLVRAADTTRDGDPDWQKGMTYVPEEPGGYKARASWCSDASADDVEHLRGVPDTVDYEPWELEFWDPCELTVGYNADEVTARLRRMADATESYGIARELWTGEVAREFDLPNPYLAKGPTVVSTAAVSPKRGIGLLEAAVGDALTGQQATFHVSRAARPYFYELVKVGQLLYTNLDNMIVADAGYPGSPPDGTAAADDVSWIYATGPVVVRRSELMMFAARDAEVVDTANNRRYRRASKVVAATFDPAVLFAVPVTLS